MRLAALIRRFCTDERAAIAMETVIITPVLVWCYLSSFIFFDAFRTYSSSIKATYAIADIVSRQTAMVRAADIDGYGLLLENLVRNNGDARLRVSQIRYDANTDSHCVEWSDATNGEAILFTANLVDLRDQLPIMAHSERLLLVQSFIPYTPVYDMGLNVVTFRNFTVTRPRYAGRVAFETEVSC
jgi:hypothetical protein